MKKVSYLIIGMLMVWGMNVMVFTVPTHAATIVDCNAKAIVDAGAKAQAACGTCAAGGGTSFDPATLKCADGSDAAGSNDLNATIHTVINIMLFIVGLLSVIMIIWSGIRYVISRGNPEDVKNAKNTLIYAIVGLIVAIIAFSIVQWVFSYIK